MPSRDQEVKTKVNVKMVQSSRQMEEKFLTKIEGFCFWERALQRGQRKAEHKPLSGMCLEILPTTRSVKKLK